MPSAIPKKRMPQSGTRAYRASDSFHAYDLARRANQNAEDSDVLTPSPSSSKKKKLSTIPSADTPSRDACTAPRSAPKKTTARRRPGLRIVKLFALGILLSVLFPPLLRPLLPVLEAILPGVFFFCPSDQMARAEIALSLDDCPDPFFPEVLQVLRELNATATIMVISSHLDKYAGKTSLVTAACEGHELSNHMPEDYPSILLSLEALKEAIIDAATVLRSTLAASMRRCGAPSLTHKVRWWRPGSGFLTPRMISVAHETGHAPVLGSIYPYDAQLAVWPWLAERWSALFVWLFARSGDVVVLHCRPHIGPTLRRIVPILQQRGLRVGTLSQLCRSCGSCPHRFKEFTV